MRGTERPSTSITKTEGNGHFSYTTKGQPSQCKQVIYKQIRETNTYLYSSKHNADYNAMLIPMVD